MPPRKEPQSSTVPGRRGHAKSEVEPIVQAREHVPVLPLLHIGNGYALSAMEAPLRSCDRTFSPRRCK